MGSTAETTQAPTARSESQAARPSGAFTVVQRSVQVPQQPTREQPVSVDRLCQVGKMSSSSQGVSHSQQSLRHCIKSGVKGSIDEQDRPQNERSCCPQRSDESSDVSRWASRYPAPLRLPRAPRIPKPGPALVVLCAVKLSPADESVQTESPVHSVPVQFGFDTRRALVDQSWHALSLAVRLATLNAVLRTAVAGPSILVITHRACYVQRI